MDCGQTAVLLSLLYYTDAAIKMTGPTTHTAMLGSNSQIPCTFTSDKPLTDSSLFTVIWYHDKKAILSNIDKETYNESKYSLNMDQALKGTADLTIDNISMADSGSYTCAVSYDLRVEKSIKVDIQASPRIAIVNNAVMTRKVSFLCCEISGFYPVGINIKWFRDGEILDNFLEGKPRENPNGTYSVNSSIILTPTEEDRGRSFSCRVEHASLLRPLKKDFTLEYGGEKEPCTKECDSTATIILGCVCSVLSLVLNIMMMIIILYLWLKKNHKTEGTQRPGVPWRSCLQIVGRTDTLGGESNRENVTAEGENVPMGEIEEERVSLRSRNSRNSSE